MAAAAAFGIAGFKFDLRVTDLVALVSERIAEGAPRASAGG
jgi:hypothetical protein